MSVNTLHLIHDCTYGLYTIAELHAKCLLDNSTDSVAVHHSTEIVQSVGQGEGLRIGQRLEQLLYATMNIAKVWIDLLHNLTVDDCLQTKYSVG